MSTEENGLHSAKEKRFVDEAQKIYKWIWVVAITIFICINIAVATHESG